MVKKRRAWIINVIILCLFLISSILFVSCEVRCPSCNGRGKCPDCDNNIPAHPDNGCNRCNDTRICPQCGGDGKIFWP